MLLYKVGCQRRCDCERSADEIAGGVGRLSRGERVSCVGVSCIRYQRQRKDEQSGWRQNSDPHEALVIVRFTVGNRTLWKYASSSQWLEKMLRRPQFHSFDQGTTPLTSS